MNFLYNVVLKFSEFSEGELQQHRNHWNQKFNLPLLPCSVLKSIELAS